MRMLTFCLLLGLNSVRIIGKSETGEDTGMYILISALIFGLVVLIVLAWNMGLTFTSGMRSTVPEKFRAILKLLLLIEVIGFIVLFVMVLVKTVML